MGKRVEGSVRKVYLVPEIHVEEYTSERGFAATGNFGFSDAQGDNEFTDAY